jgi:competence protein ComEC
MIGEPAENLAAGQRVELVGRMGRFSAPLNPGQFDRAAAARANHTLVWMSTPAADGATILTGSHRPWYSRMYWNLRAAARQHLAALGSADEGDLLDALIIGERSPSLDALNRTMIQAGIAHFLSISGQHLVVFLGFIYFLCRLCMLPPRRSAMAVLAVLAGYLLLTEPQAPLLRSAIMATALCAATIRRRYYGALNALAASAIVLLAADPLQLFSAGFQLSFVIVAGMAILHRPVRWLIFGRWLRRRGLVVFRTDQGLSRWVNYRLTDWMINIATLAIVAYASAAPLVAYHFGIFSPYAPVLSLLLSPLIVAVLVPGYISMALLWPLPGLSYVIGRGASAAAGLTSRAVEAMGVLPGLSLELRPLSVGWVVLCYAVMALVAFGRRLPFGRAATSAAGLVLCGWTVISQLPAPAPQAAELHLLSVGAGQCAILRTPAGRTFIFDAGTSSGYDAYRQVLGPFLRNQRLPAPAAAFVSHGNIDHFNALGHLVAKGDLRKVYVNDFFGANRAAPSQDESAPVQFLQLLADRKADLVRLRAGQTIELDGRTRVEVTWPPAGRGDDLSVNAGCMVLRVVCDDRSVLLPADLDEDGLRQVAAQAQKIAADVLLLPHHGGWEESLPEFFQAVGPKIVLASASRDPAVLGAAEASGRTEFYRRVGESGRYYTTCRNGWIRVRFGQNKLEARTMR